MHDPGDQNRLFPIGVLIGVLIAALSVVKYGTAKAQSKVEPRQARCDMTESFQRAQTSLADGERLIAWSDYKEANRILSAGISALGNYDVPSVVDDTGQKLVLASSEERAGHLNTAANIRASVLRSRLAFRCRE
jgi:hypothetical protein